MGIREKHLKAKEKKKELKKEIRKLRRKIKKNEDKIVKRISKIDSINTRLKEFKKELRERDKKEAAKKRTRKKQLVKKDKTLVPEPTKKLRKVPNSPKTIVPTPDRSLAKVENDKKKEDPGKKREDLTKIEGIGKKTAEVLNEKGIVNFKQLSSCTSAQLDEIIKENFPNYRVFNTLTWPEQAKLAYNRQWKELKLLQDKLTGGR